MMFRKIILVALLFSFALPALAQIEINAFKYIIIPRKYDFLKKENQYRLNTVTKHLFDKEGFLTLVQGNEYPEEVKANPCIAATVDVVNESSMLKTKLKIELKNCYDQVVFTSKVGTSKLKEYDKTYKQALENSFVSFQGINYFYDPNLQINKTSGYQGKAIVPVAVVEKPAANPAPKPAAAEPVATEPVTVEKKNLEPMEPVTSNTAVPVPVAVVPEASTATTTEKVQEPVAAAAVIVAEPETKPVESKQESETSGFAVAKSYKNDTTSFFLIEQNNVLVAYVIESKNENYKKGQTIGTFEKTSLPNVYRVAWKKKEQDIDETTAYFDEKGNLKIDIHRNGKIEVITFTEEK